jgi:hypothetical protein
MNRSIRFLIACLVVSAAACGNDVASPRIVLTVASDAYAGAPTGVRVEVLDKAGKPFAGYTGTVTFLSSDTGEGAVAPGPITFTGKEAGTAITSATFVTAGLQTISASGNTPAMVGGLASAAVHGLVYTAPTSGRVRLVANASQSTAQVVQLDLVANERLEVSSFFTGGPGSFAAGMNLPLDTTRVGEDSKLFTAGNALVVAAVPPVGIGRIGADHVLYTAVSRKRLAGVLFTQRTEVAMGQVFFSVRLKLQSSAKVGSVFDGTQPMALFRAAVRDQFGNDFVNQSDFGLGKLEVQ